MKYIIVIAGCLLLPYSLMPQSKGARDNSKSPQAFVQSFYDWYVPLQKDHDYQEVWALLMKSRKEMFSPELIEAIENDYAAQAKTEAGGPIVGIEADPFLSSQDPGEHYVAGHVTKKGKNYRIVIHEIVSGRKQKSNVSAEITQVNGHWMFINFYYPNDNNLLSILKRLREDREKTTTPATSAATGNG